MDNIQNVIDNIISSNYYLIACVIMLLFILTQGRVISYWVTREIDKVMYTKYEIVKEIKKEQIDNSKIEEKLTEYYNRRAKAFMYFVLSVASIGQLIELMLEKNSENISINVCLLTITIAFIECRDNTVTLRKMKKETNQEIDKLVKVFVEFDWMATEDFVWDNLKKVKDTK